MSSSSSRSRTTTIISRALGRPPTEYLPDTSRSIIAQNDSPDVGFEVSINPYRGCEHGCIYCYARPTHEYLGFSAGLDFETKIMVKHDAPELLRKALSSPRWRPRVLGLSGVTDAYQPVERRLELTRRCLAVLAEFRQAVGIITKNRLVTRDIDVLGELARHNAAGVFVSITSLDDELVGRLEPRTTRPAGRLKAIAALAEAGIPVGVMVAPIIPGLTEHEMPAILKAAAEAGARNAGYTIVRLADGGLAAIPGLARASLPGPKGKGAGTNPGDARRPAQRLSLRRADERRGQGGRADFPAVSADVPPGRAESSIPGRSRPRRSGGRRCGSGATAPAAF